MNKHFLFAKGKKFDLIIIDDLLPVPLSPWRNHEFETLLSRYSNSKVVLDFIAFNEFKGSNSYNEHLDKLKLIYPVLAGKLGPLKTGTNMNAGLVYTLFYNNIRKYFSQLKAKRIPFGFTLFPGGGFKFNDQSTDNDLKRIINDDLCRFVIVNQRISLDYLVNQLGIRKEKVFLIFGIPLCLKENDSVVSDEKKYFRGEKKKMDIVFMAHKYMPFGLDKGFHIFQNTALELIENTFFDFHVVGNFGVKDLLYPELETRIKFHGHISEEEFHVFFEDKDVIISPNRPDVLGKGSFDGFPLGSSIAGGINNCVMLLTNTFDESPEIFVDGIHYLKIIPSHKDIISKLSELKNDRRKMELLAHEGRNRILETYYTTSQMEKRIKIFDKYL